jgi:primosomal protein N''
MTKVADLNTQRLNRFERHLGELNTEVRSLRLAQAVEAEKSAGRDLALATVQSTLVRILERLERMEARLEIGDAP